MKCYIFIVFQLLYIIFFFQSIFNRLIFESSVYSMNKKFEVDYRIYKECIKRTNMIDCGRNKSLIHKHTKPHPRFRKKYILSSVQCKIISENVKPCNEKSRSIVIGIGTGAEYFYERHVFRLYYRHYEFISYYFFMGLSDNASLNKKMFEENKLYNDMIIFSFFSSYYNLTSQIICTLNWISSKCNNYKWYIHQTSDSYLNINKIYEYLSKYKECNCIMGYIKENVTVNQNKKNIFYIPYNIIKLKVYPKFPNGPGYFIHKSAVKEINQNINNSNPKVWMDDVFVGIVLSITNISIIKLNSNFHMNGIVNYRNINHYFLIHNLSPSEIYYLHKESFEKDII